MIFKNTNLQILPFGRLIVIGKNA